MTRAKAIETLKAIRPYARIDEYEALNMAIEALEQPHGRFGEWLVNETSFADGVRQTCTCSICGRRSVRPLGDFCRWCGADMRGES